MQMSGFRILMCIKIIMSVKIKLGALIKSFKFAAFIEKMKLFEKCTGRGPGYKCPCV